MTQSMLRMSTGTRLDDQSGPHGETPKSRLSFYLGNVLIGHFVAIGLLLLVPVIWDAIFHRQTKDTFRVDFVVDVSQLRGGGGAPHVNQSDPGRLRVVNLDKLRQKIEDKQRKEREKEEKAEKERLEKEKKEQELKDALAAKNIKVSTNIISRSFPTVNSSANQGKQLTPDEIATLIEQGARAGNYNAVPEGDALNFERDQGTTQQCVEPAQPRGSRRCRCRSDAQVRVQRQDRKRRAYEEDRDRIHG